MEDYSGPVTALGFSAVGATPTAHLRLHQFALPEIKDGEVLIQMLASPINPQDVLVLLNKYPVKPAHGIPSNGSMIPGYDGSGRVLAVGSNVTDMQQGDIVIPSRHGLGTWRSHAAVPAASLIAFPSTTAPDIAAVFRMGICPGYLLVEDMASLQPGDWIILNGGSSFISQMVTQFAHRKGLHTISVVRERSTPQETENVRQRLAKLASKKSLIITDGELAAMADFGDRRIMLALDCVFGAAGAELARVASRGATFVNFGLLGADAGRGLRVTFEMLFQKQIKFRNFSLSESLSKRGAEQVRDLLMWFEELATGGEIELPILSKVRWDANAADAQETLINAVKRAEGGGAGHTSKQLFVF